MTRVSLPGVVAVASALFVAAPASAAVPPVGPGPTDYAVQSQPTAGTCHYWAAADGDPLPDPACTPGAVNPMVSQANIASTICHGGYSDSIRPPKTIIDTEEKNNAQSYGYTGNLADAAYDYLVPIELGGDPNDPRNLWVQPPAPAGTPMKKSDVAHKLNAMVCTGKMKLTEAQEAIAHDWTTALPS